jgi:uncharacterized protein
MKSRVTVDVGPLVALLNRTDTLVPMSLADACLVRLAEIYPQSAVLTLDSDFAVYRKNGRQVIPVIASYVAG